jgi:pimeloyl-ACP methyl ester carboxylesterase
MFACIGLILLGGAPQAIAQSHPLYVQFSPGAVKGAMYTPDTGPRPHVGVLLTHRTANFLSHIATGELARRGFLVLAMNPRSDNNEGAVDFERNALDIKSGVEFLRSQPGITHVVLFGHSGGGPATSFYQAVAEQGPSYCQGPTKLVECPGNLAGLPRADGLVLMDAHPGISVNALRSINPAVVDESDPDRLDPTLDPFDPANGYSPDGDSSYSEQFQQRYFKAQAARMIRLIDLALEQRRRMQTRREPYPDDNIFLVRRGNGARLMQLDTSVHHSTLRPQKLLKNDGTVVTQVVESVRTPAHGLAETNATFGNGTRLLTVRSFLSANAIRATDAMDDIDWCSSNNSTPCALQEISVPLLITAMGGHYFVRDNEIHYEMAASEDKDFVVVEGATHGGTPCTACETTRGDYANATKNFFDYVARWIDTRF